MFGKRSIVYFGAKGRGSLKLLLLSELAVIVEEYLAERVDWEKTLLTKVVYTYPDEEEIESNIEGCVQVALTENKGLYVYLSMSYKFYEVVYSESPLLEASQLGSPT